MSGEDLDSWESTLAFCIDRALDEGVEPVRVLDNAACLLGGTRTLPSGASTRVADVLLSHVDLTDVSELPVQLLEFVNDTLVNTYPPEPAGKVVSTWLLRTLTRAIDSCPLSLLPSVLRVVSDGMATWIADAYSAFTEEEYAYDVSFN
jgi:hypothetical protein